MKISRDLTTAVLAIGTAILVIYGLKQLFPLTGWTGVLIGIGVAVVFIWVDGLIKKKWP